MQTLYRDSKGRFTSATKAIKVTEGNVTKNAKRENKIALTHYILVLDASSSIGHYGLTQAVRDAANRRIETLKKESEAFTDHKYTFSFITFAYNTQVHHKFAHQSVFPKIDNTNYTPYGDTALYDGIADAIALGETASLGENDAVLIEVITDGQENCSKRWMIPGRGYSFYNKGNLSAYILRQINTGKWTFVMQVPNERSRNLMQSIGIPEDNIIVWETSRVGTQVAEEKTSGGIKCFTTSRRAGATASSTFFQAVDLSKVQSKDLNKLTNLAHRFKTLVVDKETPIKDFIENKAKVQYVIGAAYYELTKVELVQPTKNILIMEKGKTAIYGGAEARKLLGIDSVNNYKLDPFNLSKYKIFIESTSVNRVLVRGTTVLLDTEKWTHSKPTWGDLSKIV